MLTNRESGKRLLTASTTITYDDVTNSQLDEYSCQCVAWYIQDGTWQYLVSTQGVVLPPCGYYSNGTGAYID